MKTISWKLKDVSKEYPILKNQINFENPKDFYNHFKSLFENEIREKIVIFWLSAKNRVTGFEIISIGDSTSTIINPREVFRAAIVNHCVKIIIAHNHPSGNLEPSREDISITKQLVQGGKILDIKILDHIIFTDDGYYSFEESKLLRRILK